MVDFQVTEEKVMEEKEIEDDEIFLDSFYSNDQDAKSLMAGVSGVEEPQYLPEHSLFANHPAPSKFNANRSLKSVRTIQSTKPKVHFLEDLVRDFSFSPFVIDYE